MNNPSIINDARKEFQFNRLECSKDFKPSDYKSNGLTPEDILRARRNFGLGRLRLVVKCSTKEDMYNLTDQNRKEESIGL